MLINKTFTFKGKTFVCSKMSLEYYNKCYGIIELKNPREDSFIVFLDYDSKSITECIKKFKRITKLNTVSKETF